MKAQKPYWCTAQVVVRCTCGAKFHGRSVAPAGEAGSGEMFPMDCTAFAAGMAWAAGVRHVLVKHPARADALDAVINWGTAGDPLGDGPDAKRVRRAAKRVGLRQDSNLCNSSHNGDMNVHLPGWPDSMKWSVPPSERPLVAFGYAVGLYGKPPPEPAMRRARLVKIPAERARP